MKEKDVEIVRRESFQNSVNGAKNMFFTKIEKSLSNATLALKNEL